jgi:hypothetical protein
MDLSCQFCDILASSENQPSDVGQRHRTTSDVRQQVTNMNPDEVEWNEDLHLYVAKCVGHIPYSMLTPGIRYLLPQFSGAQDPEEDAPSNLQSLLLSKSNVVDRTTLPFVHQTLLSAGCGFVLGEFVQNMMDWVLQEVQLRCLSDMDDERSTSDILFEYAAPYSDGTVFKLVDVVVCDDTQHVTMTAKADLPRPSVPITVSDLSRKPCDLLAEIIVVPNTNVVIMVQYGVHMLPFSRRLVHPKYRRSKKNHHKQTLTWNDDISPSFWLGRLDWAASRPLFSFRTTWGRWTMKKTVRPSS